MKAILTNLAIATTGCAIAGLFWIPGVLSFGSLTGKAPDSSRSTMDGAQAAAPGRDLASGPGEADAGPTRQSEPGARERGLRDTGGPERRRVTGSLVTKAGAAEGTSLPQQGRRRALSGSVGSQDRTVHIPPALAFAALAEVGKDEAAEKTWRLAIRDKSLSPGVRSDLIEDLNDTGYPDPDHLTQADLPLILHRLSLIERLYPHAMDQVNADAFEEAYKDLLQMWLELLRKQTQSGK